MIAGHFGFAAIVKSRERHTPLWALMLACQWLDVIFIPLFVAGIEKIVPAIGDASGLPPPGAPIPYGEALIYADYTHSLVGALALAVVFGWTGALIWGKRTGIVLGGVVFSHWLLDLIVHRADMPLLPGNACNLPRLGFGLWRSHGASILTELALVTVGAALYWRAAVAVSDADRRPHTLAHLAGAMMFVSGLIVLCLNVLGF